MVSIQLIEFTEEDGEYRANALIVKLFGLLFVIALGWK
jgi:hypothetical protein